MNTIIILKRGNLIFIITLLIQSILYIGKSNAQSPWGTFDAPFNGVIVDIDFINVDTGFVALANNATDTIKILKTTNKGATFLTFWKAKSQSAIYGFSIEGINANTCLVSYDDFVYQIIDGLQAHCLTFPSLNYKHKIRIHEGGIGYCLFSKIPPTVAHNFIYKTTNYGLNWTSIVDEHMGNTYPLTYEDIAIKADSPNVATMVGTIQNADGNHPSNRKGIYYTTTSGFKNHTGTNEDSIGFNYVHYLPNGETRILGSDGIYNQALTKISSLPEISPFTNQYGFKFINNNWGIAAVNDGRIIETTNGGYNWTTVATINGNFYGRSAISSVGEIVYYGDAISNTIHVRKLYTNLNTFFDNQTSNCQLTFDGNNFNTPQSTYLRGGISSLTTSNILNEGQSDERIFYKWSDGFMYSDHVVGESNGFDYYFDMSGTTISN